jgi:small subunit ribosomal protein S17
MGRRKEFTGKVIGNKMQKTCIVRIERLAKHPKYLRVVKKHVTFKVHDEKNTAQVGDLVKIEETRPLSKDKRFRLVSVVRRAKAPQVELKDETQ